MKYELDTANNEISFLFRSGAYHAEALYGAALVFTDRCFAYLEGSPRTKLKVTLKGKTPLNERGLAALAGEYHNELLNQTLRWMVAKHNKKVKEAIVTQALFAARSAAPQRRVASERLTSGPPSPALPRVIARSAASRRRMEAAA